MNQKIKNHLIEYCKKRGLKTDDQSLLDVLLEEDTIHRKRHEIHRHWDEYFYVVEIDGMLIGYINAESTGDLTPEEMGYKFDTGMICKVREREKIITLYDQID